METKSWFNVESSVFLAFALLLAYTAGNYVLQENNPDNTDGFLWRSWIGSRPEPIESVLPPPKSKASKRRGKPPAEGALPGAPKPRARDVFAPYALLQHRVHTLPKPTPNRPTRPSNPVNDPVGEVNLPPKRPPVSTLVKNPDAPEAEAEASEPAFPLLVKGFIKRKEDGNRRRVLVAAVGEPGKLFHLYEGDDVDVDEENVRVISITPDSVVFQRGDGSVHTVDKDPLHGDGPKTSGTPNASGKPAIELETPKKQLAHDPMPTTTNTKKPPRSGKKPRPKSAGKTQKEIDDLLKKLGNKKPDHMDNLGEVD